MLDVSAQAKSHGNPSLGDIVRTTAVMSAFILVLAGIAWWFTIDGTDKEKSVDYQSALASARRDAPFDLLAPRGLPAGWYANSVRYEAGDKGRWHLGVITDQDDYIGLEQTAVSERKTLEEFASQTKPAGSVSVGGSRWQLRKSATGEISLIRRADEVTVLVTGTAPQKVIERYAAGLVAG